MTNIQTLALAGRIIHTAPWYLAGAVVCGAASCVFGLAPASYLLISVGIGIIWFALLAWSWQRRSEWLRVGSLCFVLFSQQICWRFAGGGWHFEIIQGFCITFAVVAALVLLLRRKLIKFSRLENHIVEPDIHRHQPPLAPGGGAPHANNEREK